MKRVLLIFFLLSLSVAAAKAADHFFIPLNIQKAYQKGTRSYDGKPGPEYWQNHSRYSIQAKFNPATRELTGHEAIVYFNESPDTLRRLVVRLYQDLFKKGNLRDWPVSTADIHDGVQITYLKVNDDTLNVESHNARIRRYGTNLFIKLGKGLAPKTSATLEINWQLIIPYKSSIRMGRYDSTSFFIGLWYPQMAVYDDIDGWDRLNYSGIQEFYNDFSDYNVEVTVPENFVVWATGRLQNAKEALRPEIWRRYQEAQQSDQVTHVITEEDLGKVTLNNKWNTWKFKALHVPDFSFATSDHYLWDVTTAEVGSNPAHKVLIGAAFKKESESFYQVAELAKKSVLYYSNEMPAVPFPYPSLTVFNGGGGMEYPMMVNEGAPEQLSGIVHVTTHEIAHTYFPFLMGINERKYAWMDEGWATMLPFELQHREAPDYDPIARTVKRYLNVAGTEYDIPMIVPTSLYGSDSRASYRNEAYNRPGISYYFLEQLVGKKKFVKIMQEYIKRWRGKHPLPFDFFFTVNNVLKDDLSWFWKPWFFDFGYPDLALSLKNKSKNEVVVKVEKKGKLPVPVCLQILYADSTVQKIKQSMDIWKDGKSAVTIPIKKKKPILQITLGNNHIPDVFEKDNVLKLK